MAQLFSRRASTAFRVLLVLLPLAALVAGGTLFAWSRMPATWNVGKPASQPIPFRHDLHAGTLKIDCRYCHASVERAADAGMPSITTCMSCHSQVWVGASVLEPLRAAQSLGDPLVWASVHRLPPYVYFHHGIHVAKGVACESCHGRVDRMPKTVKSETLSMGFCLDCHRDAGPRLRPQEALFAMGFEPHGQELPPDLHAFYREAAQRLTSCNTCHR